MQNKRMYTIRLRDEVRTLLERAAKDQRRSMASVVEECVMQGLADRYMDVHDRLDKMLGEM